MPTIHNLQVLRGIAALLVLLFHITLWEGEYGLSTGLIAPFYWFGFAGVDLFFVLSGFLIAWTQHGSLGQPLRVPGYLFRRAWRIYPCYWLCIALYAIGYETLLNWPEAAPLGQWLTWGSLLPGTIPSHLLPHAWTLTYELTFYVAFAGLILLSRWAGRIVLPCWAMVVLFNMVQGHADQSRWLKHFLSPYILEFLGGVGIAALIRHGITQHGRTVIALSLLYAVVVGFLLRWQLAGFWDIALQNPTRRILLCAIPAIGTVYGIAAIELRESKRILHWLRPIGDASYSIYLIHLLVGRVGVIYGCYMPHTIVPHLAWILGVFIGSISLGWLIHRLFERPMLNLTRSRSRQFQRDQTQGTAS